MAKKDDDNGSGGSSRKSRYYYDPSLGKWISSDSGGFTANQYWTSPSLDRTRERRSELYGRSKWTSKLKDSLSVIGHLAHVRCFNNIMPVAYLMQQKDEVNPHGYRSIVISKNPWPLYEIDFNHTYPFNSCLLYTSPSPRD